MWPAGLVQEADRDRVGVASYGRRTDHGAVGEGEGTGTNPTDRRKTGTKRRVLTDGHGIPLAITVAGANRHDVNTLRTPSKLS